MKADRLLVSIQEVLVIIGRLLDANPTDAIGSGGGKAAVTLTDSNPSVAIT